MRILVNSDEYSKKTEKLKNINRPEIHVSKLKTTSLNDLIGFIRSRNHLAIS